MSEHTKKPFHAEIYLQTPCRDRMSEMYGEVTWCDDKINDDDTKYVRADLFDAVTKQCDDLLADIERCYKMLLSEPDTKGALFKAENILREAIASVKGGAT